MTGLPLLFAAALASISGDGAFKHAAALSALGPHAWGSPRGSASAAYVAAQFREAGLLEVRLQPFESDGLRGSNAIGVLRAPGAEFVLIGAHHDSAPDAPGAYDDGGGVGVLIEMARVLAQAPARPRTLVFVSFDGEESESQKPATKAAGSRRYVESLGSEAKNLVAALVIEMSGWKDGAPVLHPIAYADPLRPGASTIAPAWLADAALRGSASAGAPFAVGDPWLSLVYQPAVRAFKVRLYGDDISFLQAGLPALFVSDSSFSRFYPHYHRAADTADKLDPGALARMGQGALGIVGALSRAPLSRAPQADWYAVAGIVLGGWTLAALALGSLLPGAWQAHRSGPRLRALRLAQLALFAFLAWRHPVPALFGFLLPNLVTPIVGGALGWLSLLPLASVLALGAAAYARGAGPQGAMLAGAWLTAWDIGAAALLLAVLLLARPHAPRPIWKKDGPIKRKPKRR